MKRPKKKKERLRQENYYHDSKSKWMTSTWLLITITFSRHLDPFTRLQDRLQLLGHLASSLPRGTSRIQNKKSLPEETLFVYLLRGSVHPDLLPGSCCCCCCCRGFQDWATSILFFFYLHRTFSDPSRHRDSQERRQEKRECVYVLYSPGKAQQACWTDPWVVETWVESLRTRPDCRTYRCSTTVGEKRDAC